MRKALILPTTDGHLTKRTKTKTTRSRHSQGYKDRVLRLAEQVGVKSAAEPLELRDSQLYSWRSKIWAAKSRDPGKSCGGLREGRQVKYAVMLQSVSQFPLALMTDERKGQLLRRGSLKSGIVAGGAGP